MLLKWMNISDRFSHNILLIMVNNMSMFSSIYFVFVYLFWIKYTFMRFYGCTYSYCFFIKIIHPLNDK